MFGIKVHNWWTLAGAVIGVIVLYDILMRGKTSIGLLKVVTGFATDSINALKIPAQSANG